MFGFADVHLRRYLPEVELRDRVVPADHARLACVPRSPPDSGLQAFSRQIIGRMASQNSNDSSGSSSDLLNRLKGLVTDKIGIALVLLLIAAGAATYVVVF